MPQEYSPAPEVAEVARELINAHHSHLGPVMNKKRISAQWDFDLPRLVPAAEGIIEPVAHVQLLVHGSATKEGQLIHPSVWNDYKGPVAFFDLECCHWPLEMKPAQCWTDQPLVACTVLEAFCDAWAHGYVLHIKQIPIWNAFRMTWICQRLMWDTRGVSKLSDQIRNELQSRVIKSLRQAVLKIEVLLDQVETITQVNEIPMKKGPGAGRRETGGASPHL